MLEKYGFVLAGLIMMTSACTGGVAEPAFKDIVIGAQSTRCSAGDARTSIVEDGNVITMLFDRLRVEAGTVDKRKDHARCDLTLRLLSPVDAPTKIQLIVRGTIDKAKRSTVSSTIFIGKQAHPLRFESGDASHYVTTLPKGASELGVRFVASAETQHVEEALVEIDSLEFSFGK